MLKEGIALVAAGFSETILTMRQKSDPKTIHAEDLINVQLYAKKDCHLCLLAKEILSRVREAIPFELQEIDIESSKDLYRKFGERIPAVFINGEEAFTYRISEKRLKRILLHRFKSD